MQQPQLPFPKYPMLPCPSTKPPSLQRHSPAHFVFFITGAAESAGNAAPSGAALAGALPFAAFFVPCHSNETHLCLLTPAVSPLRPSSELQLSHVFVRRSKCCSDSTLKRKPARIHLVHKQPPANKSSSTLPLRLMMGHAVEALFMHDGIHGPL